MAAFNITSVYKYFPNLGNKLTTDKQKPKFSHMVIPSAKHICLRAHSSTECVPNYTKICPKHLHLMLVMYTMFHSKLSKALGAVCSTI